VSFDRVRPIADAVLYEGYALYPYRPSSIKNRQRWTFGGILPRSVSEADGGIEPWGLGCACLVEAGEGGASIEARVRFLHLLSRTETSPATSGDAWEEALEREVPVGPLPLATLASAPHRQPFSFAGSTTVDGAFAREQRAVEGTVELSASLVAPGVWKLDLRIANLTPVPAGEPREGAQRRSLASTHAVLAVTGGGFVSAQDPPEPLRAIAEACRADGLWPVLVGDPGSRDLMLCSPIILYDHPAIAPESPGDFFDGTEIDELLALRILTMTADEKREMGAADARVRALLDRAERLGPADLARLHGALRRVHEPEGKASRRVRAAGVDLGPGDPVRLRPAGRSDIFDLALAGRRATIASVEQDYEGRVFVTVTVDDDPGRDLGAASKPGHRFFFRPDEVEPIPPEAPP
jgi:hypothetical protein